MVPVLSTAKLSRKGAEASLAVGAAEEDAVLYLDRYLCAVERLTTKESAA